MSVLYHSLKGSPFPVNLYDIRLYWRNHAGPVMSSTHLAYAFNLSMEDLRSICETAGVSILERFYGLTHGGIRVSDLPKIFESPKLNLKWDSAQVAKAMACFDKNKGTIKNMGLSRPPGRVQSVSKDDEDDDEEEEEEASSSSSSSSSFVEKEEEPPKITQPSKKRERSEEDWMTRFVNELDSISGLDGLFAFRQTLEYSELIKECAHAQIKDLDDQIREHVDDKIREDVRPSIRARLEPMVRKEMESKNSQWDFLIQQHEARRIVEEQKKTYATRNTKNALLESILKGKK